MKGIAILGSTGSIGQSALSVIETQADQLTVVGLAAGENVVRFAEQVARHRPRAIAMSTASALDQTRAQLRTDNTVVERDGFGPDGLVDVATHPDVDIVLCATAGTAGLDATLAAIEAGKTIALANKEVLVMAGALMMEAARKHDVAILPVDSEHNAIHQCLHGRARDEVRRVILTASGGPFRDREKGTFRDVSPTEALDHPTWRMGPKITVDSSTLMNKGLEVIEARWLFDIPADGIDVLIHPQSIVHSLVEFRDGSVMAQLGVTDMRLPIQYAFSYPDRWDASVPQLDLTSCPPLEFDPPDLARFPCLAHAYRALSGGPASPVILNAANEVAVEAFLQQHLPFTGIPEAIEQALNEGERQDMSSADTLAEVREVDAWARRFTGGLIRKVEWNRSPL